jgi:hypothetical protein
LIKYLQKAQPSRGRGEKYLLNLRFALREPEIISIVKVCYPRNVCTKKRTINRIVLPKDSATLLSLSSVEFFEFLQLLLDDFFFFNQAKLFLA